MRNPKGFEGAAVVRLTGAFAVCAGVGCGNADPLASTENIESIHDELGDRVKPTKPSNLRITGATAYSVSLAWNPSSDNSGNFSYRVRHSWGYEATVPKEQTSFTWTGNVEPRGTYSFYVYAIDAAGNRSNSSNTVTQRLAADTTPPSIPSVTLNNLGPTHATLGFVSTDDGPFTRYSVFQNGAPIAQGVVATTTTAYLLTPATTYSFTVQALDFGANLSPMSVPLVVTTPPADPTDRTPPSVPTNLTEDHWSDGEIQLRWSPSTDNLDPPALIRYDVFVNGTLEDRAVGRTDSIVYGVDGVNAITVVARDAAGNVSAAASVTVVLDL